MMLHRFAQFLIAAMALSLLVCLGNSAYAGSRGLTINLRESEAKNAPISESLELYGNSYALVIGIDEYTNGWPKLSNAVKDAELIAVALEDKGFDVELHKNLNSDQMNRVFKSFFILKGEDPTARLFIWFAGHGATVGGEGYLIPADAPIPSKGAQFKFDSIALRDFGTFMRQAVSKHVYAVFDSCFAGTVFSSQRALPPSAITRATTRPVRQFLTSGDENQKVSDDGAFRELFLRAIKGDERADANADGYLTASELGMFLGDRVTNLTQSVQTPRYGKLRDKDFDRGDFVFSLPGGAGATLALKQSSQPTSNAASAELVFWQTIKDSKSAGEFEVYLKQYPSGSFASLARLKRDQFKKKKTKPKPVVRDSNRIIVRAINKDFETSSLANVRKTPSPTGNRVARLDQGTKVWAIGETKTKGGTWYKIARDGYELGFVFSTLLQSIGSTDDLIAVSVSVPEIIADPSVNQAQVAAVNNGMRTNSDVADSEAKTQSAAADARLSSLFDDLLADVPSSNASVNTNANTNLNTAEPQVAEVSQDQSVGSQASSSFEISDEIIDLAGRDEIRKTKSSQVIASAATEPADSAAETNLEPTTTNVVVEDKRLEVQIPATAVALIEQIKSAAENEEGADLAATVLSLSASLNTDASATIQANIVEPAIEKDSAVAENNAVEQFPAGAQGNIAEVTPAADFAVAVEPEVDAESEYIKRYIRVAEQGNPKAQLSLAYMYQTGEQVTLSIRKAADWYRRAAESGEVRAMIALGLLYESGEEIGQNLTEAAYWYRKAANNGDADAQQTLAYMYEQGEGIVMDSREAAKWYHKAAEQGRMTAQNNLGRLFQLGIGVEQDFNQAIFWYEKAAAQGSAAAKKNLNEMIPGRNP